jgi:hypothetical protein
MAKDKIYTYQSIAKSVQDHGIDTMFGLMGSNARKLVMP